MLRWLLWVFKKRCVLRVLPGMVVPFFITSCLSDQTVTLRSGEPSIAETASVVSGTLVVQGDDAEVEEEGETDFSLAFGSEQEALNAWYGTNYPTLADAQMAHTPGTQQTNMATLKAKMKTAENKGDIATATGYQINGRAETSVTNAELYQRNRYIYANQPSLDAVGAAFAYIRNDGINSDGANLGDGGQISVVTNNRFDPTHPSFDSSERNAPYDSITRFVAHTASFTDSPEIQTTAGFFNLFFGSTDSTTQGTPNAEAIERVRGYATSGSVLFLDFEDGYGINYFDIRVPTLTVNGRQVNLDTLTPANLFHTNAQATALVNALNPLTARTLNRVVTRDGEPTNIITILYTFLDPGLSLSLAGSDNRDILFVIARSFVNGSHSNALTMTHLGRRYVDADSNIDLYRLLIEANFATHNTDAVLPTATHAVADVAGATDASMGLLALINGRRNLGGLTVFADLKIATQGIAPNARLKVFSTPTIGAKDSVSGAVISSATNLIYRARNINVLAGTVSGANVTITVDMSRNIVLLQNTIAHADRVEPATQANIDDVAGIAGSTIDNDYKDIYDALKLGVADTNMQDIYVFAAADGRITDNDPGLLASLAGAQESGDRLFADYSLVVTASETAAHAYCGSVVADFCITAPGTYSYRGRGSDNAYGGDDDTLETIGTPTSNAAASLVAGGLAVLIDVLGDQITTKELVRRVLSTAATRFDLDGDDENDYRDTGGLTKEQRYGVGMFDLECASRPLTRRASACQQGLFCEGSTPFENSARDGCVAMCDTGEGLSSSSGSGRRCITAGDVTAQQCAHAGQLRLAGAGCVTADACRTGNRAVSGNSCVTGTAQTCFEDGGRGFSDGSCAEASASSCLKNSGYRFDSGTNVCIALMECSGGTPFLNSALDMCAAICASGEGVSAGSGASVRVCIASGDATAQQCVNNGAVRLADNSGCADRCSANNAPDNGQCGLATTVCATTDGYNSGTRTCVTSGQTATTCQALDMRVLQTGGNCAAMCANNNAPNVSGQCGTATSVCTGAQGYDSDTNTCIAVGDVMAAAECAVFTGTAGKNVYRPTMGCVTASACRGSGGRAVNQNECVTASAPTCFEDGGQGFTSGTGCVNAGSGTCLSSAGYRFDSDTNACVVRINIPTVGLMGITSEATAKAIFTADTSSVTPASSEQLRIAKEYQNQPSLAQVGAADAYARGADAMTRATDDLRLGQRSDISVITNTRFDPTHPEFSSSDESLSYDTLTRFYLGINSTASINTIAHVITLFFNQDAGELVQVYDDDFRANFEAYVTIPVHALNRMAFERITRDAFDANVAIRNALRDFMSGLLGGARVTQDPLMFRGSYYLQIDSTDSDYIEVTSAGNNTDYSHIGRVYTDASNIASYQIVVRSKTDVQKDDGTPDSDVSTLALASDADMGLLALINGLLDPARSDSTAELNANTHGIAPLASMHVFTSFKANETHFNGSDLMYRARGIDVARDRDDDGKLIADDDRNIVLVHNTIADNALNQAATQANIDDAVGLAGSSIDDSYKSLYDALKVGVADTTEQDIYVFAAADGRTNDAGLLASMAAAQESGNRLFADYSIVVVAAEAGQTPCGNVVRVFCIAAPGAYTYIDKESGSNNSAYDDTDVLVAGSVTANAAASLVAGGLALLQNIFGDQITSKDLVARVISTADTSFMGYDAARHGRGMLNLEAASRPILRTNIPTVGLTGITDEATAKAVFTNTSSVTHESSPQQRIAKEYQNQPSLAQVNAADAYARNAGSSAQSTIGLNLGQGSQISVITNDRFDPTHPEFSSSASDARYDTLTRFYLELIGGNINNIDNVIPFFFSKDDDELVHVYLQDLLAGSFYFTIPVPALNDGTNDVAFETIPRDEFNGAIRIRSAFLTFMKSLVSGTRVTQNPVSFKGAYYLQIDENDNDYIELTAGDDNSEYSHIGRVYGETSNIASYQIVADPSATNFQNDKGDSLSGITGIDLASDADMGLLALINGLIDPARSDSAAELNANTHGIAPLAYVHVFSSFKAHETQFNGSDLIVRARGIDVARDRNAIGNVIADDDRNIVLVHNTIADSAFNQVATQSNINSVLGVLGLSIPNNYQRIYGALRAGVADTNTQDIYVFAAEDGRTNDVGLLASMAAAQESGNRLFADYSVVVVAAGAGSRTPCGSVVADFCIAAPGAYRYIDKESGSSPTAYDDTDVLVAGSVTANAAASLVAGGLAVLESIFGSQLTTKQLVDRLLRTASKDFDLDGTAGNDYQDISGGLTKEQQYGVGLMDLAAASVPITQVDYELTPLNDWYGTSHASLVAAQMAHTPGTQQTNLQTLKTNLAGADSDNSIKGATGYQNDGTAETSVTDDELYQRSRYIYANQPSLDAIGAAFAYIRNDGVHSDGSNLGEGGQISVVTNNRFDPTHPSFSSSESDAQYDSITRFFAQISSFVDRSSNPELATTAGFFNLFFGSMSNSQIGTPSEQAQERVRGYVGTDSSIRAFFDSGYAATFFDIHVPTLTVNGSQKNLDTLTPANLFNTAPQATALATALNPLTARELTRFVSTIGDNIVLSSFLSASDGLVLDLASGSSGSDGLTIIIRSLANSPSSNAFVMTHLGRRYIDENGNIDLYRLLIRPNVALHDTNAVLSVATNDLAGVTGATDESMGLLALINGRRHLGGLSTFADLKIATHGIAPEARLRVFSTPVIGNTNTSATDLIYRARDINVLAGTVSGANVTITIDMSRNIVLLQNTIAHASRSEAATQAHINDVAGIAGSTIDDDYKDIYDALKLGVADTNMQDIYVFAAYDNRGTQKDPGIFASLAGVQEDTNGDGTFDTRLFADYSLVVTASESAADAYCGTVVADICITAPGTYTYRGRGSDNTYGTSDDTLETIGTPTSNAAASLVAGGLAVLIDVFGDQITTQRLVARVLNTADTSFTGYDSERHGKGMFNLEAASRPITMGSNSPFEEQSGGRYCNIEGLRIILSGDLCSDDHIQIADADGNLIADAVGNLRLGMGFGDALLGGGIAFFDAFDTAWKADNPYNPYAHVVRF